MTDQQEQSEVEGQMPPVSQHEASGVAARANEDADATSDDLAEVEGQARRPQADGTSDDDDPEVEGQARVRSIEDQSPRR